MLLDIDYAAEGDRNTPRLFRARLEHGILRVAHPSDEEA